MDAKESKYVELQTKHETKSTKEKGGRQEEREVTQGKSTGWKKWVARGESLQVLGWKKYSTRRRR